MDQTVVIQPYEPFDWKDHIVARQRTYKMTDNGDGTITLTPAGGVVYQQGTPMCAERFNHMERGIANNDARLPVVDICTIDISAITSELYPRITLLSGGYGYGIGGYGETPAGGTGMTTVDATYVYDEGMIHVIVPKQYAAYTVASQIGERTFALTTGKEDDETSLTLIIH